MELSSVLSKVRAAITLAEDPRTPPEEAANARAFADRLMEKYAIEEWEALKTGKTGLKPDRIKMDIGEEGDPFLEKMALFVNLIANHCRCSSIWISGSGRKGYRNEYCWVYGYESDLRYFELLYTTLHLHMAGAMMPSPDPALSMAENAYTFRQAGLNWIEIAQAWGYFEVERRDGEARNMYRNHNTGEQRYTWSQAVGKIKKEALKEYAKRDEAPPRIPPSSALNFRYNAINGYIARISQRLREVRAQRGVGTELVLRDRSQNVSAALAADFPNIGRARITDIRFNAEAYARGTRHANTASLNPEAGTRSAPAVGA